MRKVITLLLISVLALPLYAQTDTMRTVRLDEVNVIGQRPLFLLGASRTTLDSVRLAESPMLSLGDLLSQSSSVFIKSYGRGTMSTASFRGTSPSHTEVQWNGLRINSPMLGQVDLSLVPSYFIDDLSLWHGISSSNVTAGALGGAVTLANKPFVSNGHRLAFVQSVGQYATLDTYLRYGYGRGGLSLSTRLYRASSENNFAYRNFSKVNLLDDGSVSKDYETSYNRNSEYSDLHLMQELYYKTSRGDKISGFLWFMSSDRGVPMLQTDQRNEYEYRTQQTERTLRSLINWRAVRGRLASTLKLGYTYTHQLYRYTAQIAPELATEAIHTSSYIRSVMADAMMDYRLAPELLLHGSLNTYYHHVDTWDRRTRMGYLGGRTELSGLVSLRYRPSVRLGMATNLRMQLYGADLSPLGATLLADYILCPSLGLRAKASVGNNYRFPTLNDLYYEPGGNAALRPERSFNYDLGLELPSTQIGNLSLSVECTLFDSYIKDWILWLPTFKGYWTPTNVREVHNYGVEAKMRASIKPKHWQLSADVNAAYTRARNNGEALNPFDASHGKQLPYIPVWQAGVVATLQRGSWQLLYKYNYYSERFTTSNNVTSSAYSRLGAYHMSDLSLEWRGTIFTLPAAIKATVNNLLGEEYVSVLHRPMPRRQYSITVSIVPIGG